MTVAVFGVAVLAFFHAMERNMQVHIIDPRDKRDGAVLTKLDFGTAQTRALLRSGWLADEQWLDGKQSVVWATGLTSEATLELPFAQSYRFRLHVFPYSPKGPACQTLEVRLNDKTLSRIFLEQGWRQYELPVPQAYTRAGKNDLQFRFNYTESPKSRERSSDTRLLSVAFDNLEVLSAQ
jgi:hypothetical protein